MTLPVVARSIAKERDRQGRPKYYLLRCPNCETTQGVPWSKSSVNWTPRWQGDVPETITCHFCETVMEVPDILRGVK